MKQVKIADLKNNLSRHLAHVRGGGELTVFDRETPVARIVPYTPRPAGRAGGDEQSNQKRLADLERQGVIRRGDPEGVAAWLEEHKPARLPKSGPSLLDLLLRARRESTR
jgi:antitoxin (DNA-binding transcriptional repressor) of toxin-antitoxin stability system